MKALELADILQQSDFLAMDFAEDAATMLRQQQAEIEALKAGKIRAYDNGVEDGRKPDTNNEPVAWMYRIRDSANKWGLMFNKPINDEFFEMIPLYTHPADLTDEEINELWLVTCSKAGEVEDMQLHFARAILRKAQET